MSGQYISDLGIGPSALVFNSSVFLLGLLLLVGTYFLRCNPDFGTLSALLFLMAVGTMGVGVFTKAYTAIHGGVATMAFFFSGVSAVYSCKVLNKPLAVMSIVLGVATLSALGLFSVGMYTSGSLTSTIEYDSSYYLGLGPGGMERMIVYPALLWLIAFSGHLTTQ